MLIFDDCRQRVTFPRIHGIDSDHIYWHAIRAAQCTGTNPADMYVVRIIVEKRSVRCIRLSASPHTARTVAVLTHTSTNAGSLARSCGIRVASNMKLNLSEPRTGHSATACFLTDGKLPCPWSGESRVNTLVHAAPPCTQDIVHRFS